MRQSAGHDWRVRRPRDRQDTPHERRPRGRAPQPADDRNTHGNDEAWRQEFAWRWWLIGMVVLLLVAGAALLKAPFFAIGAVQLSGEARTSEGAIAEVLAIPEGQALATFDLDAAADRISTLPWIAGVEVRREWPSTLRVQVVERVPAAALASASTADWVVVSEDLVVVERRLTPPTEVPVIVVPSRITDAAVVGRELPASRPVVGLARSLPPQLEPWIDSWTMDARGVITAELVGSASADFGFADQPVTQFVSLASILDGGTSLACITTIDLTVADTPVIHRNLDCLV